MTVHVTVFAGQMALVVSAALVAYSGAGDLACCLSAVVVHAGVCCRRGSCRCVWLELGAGHIVSEAEGMWCGLECFNTVPQLRFELPGVMHGVSLLLLCIAYVLDNTFHLG